MKYHMMIFEMIWFSKRKSWHLRKKKKVSCACSMKRKFWQSIWYDISTHYHRLRCEWDVGKRKLFIPCIISMYDSHMIFDLFKRNDLVGEKNLHKHENTIRNFFSLVFPEFWHLHCAQQAFKKMERTFLSVSRVFIRILFFLARPFSCISRLLCQIRNKIPWWRVRICHFRSFFAYLISYDLYIFFVVKLNHTNRFRFFSFCGIRLKLK